VSQSSTASASLLLRPFHKTLLKPVFLLDLPMPLAKIPKKDSRCIKYNVGQRTPSSSVELEH
jgi:hypothetical protein